MAEVGWKYPMVDVTVTEFCNMGCGYCYFGDKTAKNVMPEEIRRKIVDLIFSAPGQGQRRLHFFGGEPLAVWPNIKEMVEHAIAVAKDKGLTFSWGVTTNMTLLTEEMVPFFRETRGGVHCSIDGIPEVMDAQRPHKNHKIKSKDWIAAKVALALKITPQDTARMTVTPHSVGKLFQNIAYCFTLGFKKVAPVPAYEAGWTEDDWATLERQMGMVAKWYLANHLRGNKVYVKFLDESVSALENPKPRRNFCGAGRNMVAVDMLGRIAPCHRFSATHKHDLLSGNIMDPTTWSFDETYKPFLQDVRKLKLNDKCQKCDAQAVCSSGCPSVNFEASGDISLNTPEQCRFTRLAMQYAKPVWAELLKNTPDRVESGVALSGRT